MHACNFCAEGGLTVVGRSVPTVRICGECIRTAAAMLGVAVAADGTYRIPIEALATYILEGLELLREIRDAQSRPVKLEITTHTRPPSDVVVTP